MRRTLLAAIAALLWAGCLPSVLAGDFGGDWEGPWYRGMTSGTMLLQIGADGSGMVAFRNLDNFGDEAVEISRVTNDGKRFGFSASGEGPGVFSASAKLTGSGKVLEGKGEYEGFPIKFKLKRR